MRLACGAVKRLTKRQGMFDKPLSHANAA